MRTVAILFDPEVPGYEIYVNLIFVHHLDDVAHTISVPTCTTVLAQLYTCSALDLNPIPFIVLSSLSLPFCFPLNPFSKLSTCQTMISA